MNTMTEDEARTKKWCPMARVRDDDAGSYNRWITVLDDDGCRETAWCIGSRCMAWRWAPSEMATRRIYKGTPEYGLVRFARFPPGGGHVEFFEFDSATWRYEFTSSDSRGQFDQIVRSADDAEPTHGYCGAFGRPDQ